MNRLLGRIGRSDLRRHPLQTGLAVLGVAIAVAVVVAVDLANHSAREAMRVSLESVTGKATHQLVGHRAWMSVSTPGFVPSRACARPHRSSRAG